MEKQDHRPMLNKRVEIPVHYNAWINGARFGVVTAYRNGKNGQADHLLVRLDNKKFRKQVKLWRLDWRHAKFQLEETTQPDPVQLNKQHADDLLELWCKEHPEEVEVWKDRDRNEFLASVVLVIVDNWMLQARNRQSRSEEDEEDASISGRDIEEFNSYLANCTPTQVVGVYEKESAAKRHAFIALVRAEANRRNIALD